MSLALFFCGGLAVAIAVIMAALPQRSGPHRHLLGVEVEALVVTGLCVGGLGLICWGTYA